MLNINALKPKLTSKGVYIFGIMRLSGTAGLFSYIITFCLAEYTECGSRKCLPCERIEWGLIADGKLCPEIDQDDTIHGINDVFWAVAGNCAPQVDFEGDRPNPVTGKLSCFVTVRLPRAHKKVDWGQVKGRKVPHHAGYFHFVDFTSDGSCYCTLSTQDNRTCRW